MADINVSRKHNLDLDGAKALTTTIVDNVKADFPSLVDEIKWNSDKTSAKVKGKGFKGNFSVDDTTMSIEISLAFFAKPFKGKVEGKIKERMNNLFS